MEQSISKHTITQIVCTLFRMMSTSWVRQVIIFHRVVYEQLHFIAWHFSVNMVVTKELAWFAPSHEQDLLLMRTHTLWLSFVLIPPSSGAPSGLLLSAHPAWHMCDCVMPTCPPNHPPPPPPLIPSVACGSGILNEAYVQLLQPHFLSHISPSVLLVCGAGVVCLFIYIHFYLFSFFFFFG